MIKVSLLPATPVDSPLNIDEELRAIDQRIRSSEHRDHGDLIKHGAVRLEDVASLLMRHKPHIVHFSGHGATIGIALTEPDGKGRLVPPDALANIFQALKTTSAPSYSTHAVQPCRRKPSWVRSTAP